MGYGLQLITPPNAEPLELEAAKQQVRVEDLETAFDQELGDLIGTAREVFEAQTGRQLITARWDLVLDRFPRQRLLPIPKPPLQQVVSIKYFDTDGNEQTFDAANYDVSIDSSGPGRVALKPSQSWPTTESRIDAVKIRFDAGYSDDSAGIPWMPKQALKLLVGHWFRNHEDADERNLTEIPHGAQTLMRLCDPGDEFTCYGPEISISED